MPFMPGFRKHKADACYVGRIIAGYGEFEILSCNSAGYGLAVRRGRQPGTQINIVFATRTLRVIKSISLAVRKNASLWQRNSRDQRFSWRIYRRNFKRFLARSIYAAKRVIFWRIRLGIILRMDFRSRRWRTPPGKAAFNRISKCGMSQGNPCAMSRILLGSFSGAGNDQYDLRGQERIASTP
jgi:hypothetical protein